MKVVDLVPGKVEFERDVDDSADLDMREASFEMFQQAMLNEPEFCNDVGKDRKNRLPPTHNNGLSQNKYISSKQKGIATTAKKASPTKVMDFDAGSPNVPISASCSSPSNQNINILDYFEPMYDNSWEDVRQSDGFESQRKPGFDASEEGENVALKILFENEPKGGKLSNKNDAEGKESAKNGEAERVNWSGDDFGDHRGQNGEDKSNIWNKTAFDDEQKLLSWVSAHEDDVYEGKEGSKLDSHGFPRLFADECVNKEQHASFSQGGTNSFLNSSYLSLPACPVQTNAKGQTDTNSLEEAELKQSNNDGKQKEPSHWERLLSKVPPGMRTSVEANISQVRRTIMACHQPDFRVAPDEVPQDVSMPNKESAEEPVNAKERSFELIESALNTSAMSYKSCQRLSASFLSKSQEALSIPSDASTPIRTQTRRTRTEPVSLQNISLLEHVDGDGEDSDSILKLCIDRYEQPAFRRIMESLTGDLQIRELHASRSLDGSSNQWRNTEDISLLFKTMRSLSNLEILNLENFHEKDIHFVALTQWQNHNLHTIRINVSKGAISQRLLTILAELPELRDLTLEMNESFPFHILFSSRTLESLTIVANDFTVDNLHAMEMVQSVPKNKMLKKLIIEPPMRPRTFKLLASALRKNTGIQHLEFSLLPGNHSETNSAVCELARTLSGNASLKTVLNINHSNIKVKERTCEMLIGALAENYIIENLTVFDEAPWFRKKKDMVLKENQGDIGAIIPEIFRCVDEVRGNHWDGDEHNGERNDETDDGSYSGGVGDSIATIGNSVKSQAKRAASGVAGALDLVGIRM